MQKILAAAIQLYAKAYLVDERIRCEKVAQMHLANLINHIKSSKLSRRWSKHALQLSGTKIHAFKHITTNDYIEQHFHGLESAQLALLHLI